MGPPAKNQLRAEVSLRPPGRPSERDRLTLAWYGPRGLDALHPTRRLDPRLMGFYRERIAEWLTMELPAATVEVAQRPANAFEVHLEGRSYQLRHGPDQLAWLLLRRHKHRLSVVPPERPGLSLVDALARLRKRETLHR